jgi:hypothetical protein
MPGTSNLNVFDFPTFFKAFNNRAKVFAYTERLKLLQKRDKANIRDFGCGGHPLYLCVIRNRSS